MSKKKIKCLSDIITFDDIGMSAEDRAKRKNGLGASDANTIMGGDPEKVYNLWLEKTGQKEAEDLSDVLPVMMGNATEYFNILWFQKRTGRIVTDKQAKVQHPEIDWLSVTLDGMTTTPFNQPAVFDAKHVNQYSKTDEVLQRYMPQMHINMDAKKCNDFVLSVFVGTLNYEIFEGEMDVFYLEEVKDNMARFWDCVTNKIEPDGFKVVETPDDATMFRQVDMTGNNQWGSFAADYLENEKSAKTFNKAKTGLKKLVENDVDHAYGHGLQVKRSASGSLLFSKQKGGK